MTFSHKLVSIVFLSIIALPFSAKAGDNWQGRPSACDMPPGPRLEACQYWIQTVQRPDVRGASCCGLADFFLADNFEQVDGELWAVVTGEYPDVAYTDEEGNTLTAPPRFHKGSRVLIPPEKVNHLMEDSNKSGHGGFFARPSNGEILCFFFPPLI